MVDSLAGLKAHAGSGRTLPDWLTCLHGQRAGVCIRGRGFCWDRETHAVAGGVGGLRVFKVFGLEGFKVFGFKGFKVFGFKGLLGFYF